MLEGGGGHGRGRDGDEEVRKVWKGEEVDKDGEVREWRMAKWRHQICTAQWQCYRHMMKVCHGSTAKHNDE